MADGKIIKISGPLIVGDNMPGARMFDMVEVGEASLLGEIIELHGENVSIQVYEETSGLKIGEPIKETGRPLSVELGPGLIGTIYDGIQRPLRSIREMSGDFISRGFRIPGLDRGKKWKFTPSVKEGGQINPGDILGEVPETNVIRHRVLIPPGIEGILESVKEGEFTVDEKIAEVKTNNGTVDIKMMSTWPVRQPRPVKIKLAPDKPLITGQRVIDAYFPIAEGGTACIPGPFGSGKTVALQAFAKWAHADLIVYIGCGERGNEMTDVLMEFPELEDPKTGGKLIERTTLIANTSNMPVAAREASVYTGITIAEYFRDMGYSVAVMADSTSRWAEALREMSGRLEEMPGEEGYPAYLPTRLAQFYERAGRVDCLGSARREGAVSILGAVSPPGGDLSDPVVQGTLKVVQVFWSLEDRLAYRRHFPAINWLNSYSLYLESLQDYLEKEVSPEWPALRDESMRLLQTESELEEVARLVGLDTLSINDRLILETTRRIREDFLQQNAFEPVDTYSSPAKQYRMLKIIMDLHSLCADALENGAELKEISGMSVNKDIARMKFIPEEEEEKFKEIEEKLRSEIGSLIKEK